MGSGGYSRKEVPLQQKYADGAHISSIHPLPFSPHSGTLAHVKAVFTAYLTLLLVNATAFAQPVPPVPGAAPSGPPIHLICFYTENKAAGKTGFVYAIPGEIATNAFSVLYPTIGKLKGGLIQHNIIKFDLETNLIFASTAQRPLTATEVSILLQPIRLPPAPPAIPKFNKLPSSPNPR